MKTNIRALLLSLCAVLLVAASVLGTLAYLTAEDQVENTFTIGQVGIRLDEAAVNETGALKENAERVKENSYRLLPGHTYAKDPTVTVLSGSEESYIRMTVTFSNADELDAIFAPGGAEMTDIFNGYDADTWVYRGNTHNAESNSRTYEFWYRDTVQAEADDVVLKPLFESLTIPGELTNEQLASIESMTITVNANAIQADGFANAEAAWAAF